MGDLDWVMTVSGNGQVSIPAAVRARWRTDARMVPGRVRIVDLGDQILVAPLLSDPVAAARGKYVGRGPTVDEARAQARQEDAGAEGRPKHRTPGRRRAS